MLEYARQLLRNMTEEEQPDREEVYEWGFEEAIPDQFRVTHEDSLRHPLVSVNVTSLGLDDIRISDQRTHEMGDDVVCCRVTPRVSSDIKNGDENFDTLAEAEKWLIETSKQVLEWADNDNVVESLNRQVTLYE